MQTLNKLVRTNHKEVFDLIDEYFFPFDTSLSEHRRGSSFYTKWVYQFTEDQFPSNPEFWGFWETIQFVNDDEYGFNKKDIYELYRVEKQTKIIEETVWVKVN